MKGNALKFAVVALAALSACKPQGPEGKTSSPAVSANKNPGAVKLEFFVMSQCPFGVDVVNKIKEPADKLGADLDLSIDFIGQTGADGNMTSMHGPNEVIGDTVQLCAMKYAPAKFLDMVVCQNKNSREIATNWEQCAKDAQLPVDQIRSCKDGQEGKDLLKASFKHAEEKNAKGSPTIFLAGKPYTGKRSANAFLKEICNAYAGTKPAACQNIPAPVAVNVTILSDKRCSKCQPERWMGMLKQRLENPVIKTLDYGDAEGKAFYESLGNPNALLPMVLFDASLEADKDANQMFGKSLQPVGTYKALNVGGSWNPACANEGGCKLDQCKDSLACRKDQPKKLEVFVMSQCPYGVKALNAMEEVLKNFDNKIDFGVHYIGGGTAAGGFNSMHGAGEVEEDLREICAMKHYNKNYKWMEYVLCRNKDIRAADWQKCATAGIDAKVLEKCAGDEGKKLLEEDFKVSAGLGIGASPTWVANGKNEFSALDPESIKKNVCDANKDLKGCDKTLSGPAAGAPVKGGCGQ